LFIEGFGKDMLSDMTTNIIRKSLIEYTQHQCELHSIPLTDNVASGFYWSSSSMQWEQLYTKQLIVDDRIILLVPKGVASFSKTYTPERYYNHFVLNFMQSEELRIKSSLVLHRKDGSSYVTKASIKEKHPLTKDFLAGFSKRNPKILENFKNRTTQSSLAKQEISEINIPELNSHLLSELSNIAPGTQHATDYHRLIVGILEIIFYPHLIYPKLEKPIHDGRKRIDITFDNGAENGIFLRLHQNMGIPCQYIMIECKNYKGDPTNPELDQLSGRFSPNRGKVGFLLCRKIDNMNLFLNRCKDTYNDQRGLIIPVTDDDIINLLKNYNDWNNNFIDKFLADRMREITN